MKPFSSIRAIGIAVLVLATAVVQAAELTIIDLHNRSADELLPILRPLVSADTALSGVDYKLLIRGNANEVARIREVIAALDRAPRQLMITVRYNATPQSNDNTFNAGTVNGNSQIIVRGGITTRTASDSNTSSVRVQEGNGAHIATGQSIPIVTAVMASARSQSAGVATAYRELTSGFDVIPRVNGERVVLDISTQQERAINSHSGSATVQRASTTLSGRLGQWIDLGGVTSSSEEQRGAVGLGGGSNRISTQSDTQSIAVKVEQVE